LAAARRVFAIAALLLLPLIFARGTPAQEPSAPAVRRSSVANSPGYIPLVDPESMSVVIGRRLNAPLVSKPFRFGAPTLDSLGRKVCRGLHLESRDSLMRLCVTDDEFREILWPEFPQSRPVTGLTWGDAWTILWARLHAGCSHAVRDYGGHWYQFLRFEGDTISNYKNFKLHARLVLVARDDEGNTVRMKWLRTVAERKGAFKIYSTED